MQFPQNQSWKVSPTAQAGADLVMTKGVQLSKPDRIKIAKKPIVLYTNSDDSNVGVLLSLQSDENGYYFITNDGIYNVTTFSQPPAFTEITSTGAPNSSLGRDGVFYNGLLHVGGGSVVKSYASGSWTSRITGLDNAYPIRLTAFQNKTYIAVGNKNSVLLYDSSYSLITTMVVPAEYIITGMVWRLNNLYIFSRNASGGTACMFVWNGAGTNYQFGFGVQADWIYSGCEYDNNIVVCTSAGQILAFNGGGFTELANFPVYNTPYSWSSSSSLINGTGKLSFRGMTAIGKRLLLNIDGSVSVQGGGYPGVYLAEQPSGLWEYNPDNGLHHKAGYCHTKYSTLSVTEVASNRLVTSAHGLSTGDAVYLNALGSLTGVVNGQTYFAIVEGATSFQLALSPSDAYNNKPITLGGSAGVATVCVDTTNEIGATFITAPGAIGLFNKNLENVFFGSELFWGGETPNDAGTNIYAFMSLGMGRSRAVLTTVRAFGTVLTDTFSEVSLFLNDVFNSFEQVVVKKRSRKYLGYPSQVSTSGISMVTWTSSTVFTAPAANRDLSQVAIGDECTVIQGAGSGYTAHVSAISFALGTWTVTLDEAIGNITNGNKSEVQFDNWTKEKVITSTDSNLLQGYATVNLRARSAWLELKLELRGRDLSLDRILLPLKADKKQP